MRECRGCVCSLPQDNVLPTFLWTRVLTAMKSSATPFARLNTHGSPWRARSWKGCCVASTVAWTLSVVGFAAVSWSHATSIANFHRELQEMKTMLGHRPPEDHGATLHDGLMETFPVGESCCERISTLRARVDLLQQDVDDISSQLDQKASLVLVMALQNDLQQKASVQNVSRLQQDLFELSLHLDEKADMADVTALRSDLAQKASTQSITQLQSQVDVVQDAVRQKASLQNLSRLEGVVRVKASVGDAASKVNETALKSVRAHLVSAEAQLRQKANETALESVRAQLVAAEAQLRQKAAASSTPRFADLPVTPNMMKDTKHFHSVCHGRVGVETPWADAWGSRWEFFNYLGTAVDAAPSTVKVVDMTSQASADRAGL